MGERFPHNYIKAQSQTVLQICLKKLICTSMYKLTSQHFLQENATDTKQKENCKSFQKYHSIVFNTSILLITIFPHICNLLTEHLYLSVKRKQGCFLRFPGSKMEEN